MESEDSRNEPEDVVLNSVGGGVNGPVVKASRIRDVIIHQHAGPRPNLPHRIGAVPARVGCFQQRRPVDAGEFVPAGTGRVLSGLGGVGKTQLAAELAEHLWFEGEIELLVWVAASSREAITSAYAAAAAELGWDPDGNPERGPERFLAGLASSSWRWLVVLDDLRSPGDATGLWPPDRPQGRTLATTRRRDAALVHDRRELVDIGVFTAEQSLAYLTARLANRPQGAESAAELTGAEGAADFAGAEGAAELAADLGHLPLALAQAAAYLLDEDLDCHEYRALLADRSRRLADVLPEQEALPDEQVDPVTATLALSVELAGRLRPVGLAPKVLEVAAMLDPQGIPAEVFTSTAVRAYLERVTGDAVDQHAVRSALRCLHRLNLITEDSGANSRRVRVHALVQRAARDQLTADQLGALVHSAADGLYETWPRERSGDLIPTLRTNTEALHPHAPGHLYECCCHPLLFLVGASLGRSGAVTAAVEHFQRMRETAARYSDPEQHGVLTIRLELAWWRGVAGDLDAAVADTEQVADVRAQAFGPDSPAALEARVNLARLRSESGDVAGGLAELNSVVPVLIRVLGADHDDTLSARVCLANDQASLGDIAGSVTAMEVLLADMLRTREKQDPGVLSVRHSLALRHGEAGHVQQAAAEFGELLEDRLQVHGPDHPNTLQTRGLLATYRARAGEPEHAVEELEILVQDRLRVQGPDHPDTLSTRDELATQRAAAGDARGALEEMEGLLPDALRALGRLHPTTLSIRQALAIRRGEAGDPHGAVELFADLVPDTQRVLDPRAPNALAARHNFAFWQAEAGDTAQALAELESLLPEMLQVLGEDHPHTRATRLNIDRLRGED
ncbi:MULTISPECIES: tetratricopeptide repeat protein [unclassified Saccharopolyspora]|uniref:tetratricopeptide repeat protein n=1 Tax=Saccharopolyspora TaxID=1835 RepID=UPI00190A7149|nr:tetratricopeptide repeat protein [Saccharopolyspora sp. HNM0986]MBK0868404.1 tetratricopeptide repeat protein [Saccharopolyspora sp. HNM0986]